MERWTHARRPQLVASVGPPTTTATRRDFLPADAVDVAVATLDAADTILAVNTAFTALFTLDPVEAEGQPLAGLVEVEGGGALPAPAPRIVTSPSSCGARRRSARSAGWLAGSPTTSTTCCR
jgi:PAS domain-containing protein